MLKLRLVTGSLLLAAVALMVFWRSPWAAVLFLGLGGALVILAVREYFRITETGGIRGYPRLTMSLAALQLIAIAILSQPDLYPRFKPLVAEYLIFASFMVLGFARVALAGDFQRELRHLVVSLGGYMYLIWTLSFLAKVYFIEGSGTGANGPYLLFYLILVTKASDIGGYTFGKSTALLPGGNHKLVPRVSPGKSWEGLLGSILFSIGASWAMVHFLGDKLSVGGQPVFATWSMLMIGFALAVIGLVGDLTESLIKRAFGVKDSGAVLPGMGGALDAVDSLILVAPLFYCFLSFRLEAML